MADIASIGRQARAAGQELAGSTLQARNAALVAVRDALAARAADLLAANAADLEAARTSGLEGAIVKRLVLDDKKLADLAKGLDDVVALADPLGAVSLARELSPGLELRRVSCPIGVICVIFEARPEAVVQIASLAIKAGNAVILKGGKEAQNSNRVLVDVIRGALATLPADARVAPDCVQLVSSRDEVASLLQLDTYIDLVIPRGSNKLVRDIKSATRIPVLGHADGICAVYVDGAADLTLAAPVVVDSKIQYPAACNAAETLLVQRRALKEVLPAVGGALLRAGVTLHADAECAPILRDVRSAMVAVEAPHSPAASSASSSASSSSKAAAVGDVVDAVEHDFVTEWLDLHMSVGAVEDVRSAVRWVNSHGSHHTDCIVTQDAEAAAYFLDNVDSAGVYHNASTRFADGFRYGFGAEVGISTNRVHARGPVGLEGLLTYKYKMAGSGQCVAQFAGTKGPAGTVSVGGKELPALSFTHKELARG